MRTNINVLINIGPRAGGGRKKRGKKGNLPNTFDDDCRSSINVPNKIKDRLENMYNVMHVCIYLKYISVFNKNQ